MLDFLGHDSFYCSFCAVHDTHLSFATVNLPLSGYNISCKQTTDHSNGLQNIIYNCHLMEYSGLHSLL